MIDKPIVATYPNGVCWLHGKLKISKGQKFQAFFTKITLSRIKSSFESLTRFGKLDIGC